MDKEILFAVGMPMMAVIIGMIVGYLISKEIYKKQK